MTIRRKVPTHYLDGMNSSMYKPCSKTLMLDARFIPTFQAKYSPMRSIFLNQTSFIISSISPSPASALTHGLVQGCSFHCSLVINVSPMAEDPQ